MISIYVREQKRYTLEELSLSLSLSIEKTLSIIRKLKEVGIIKAVKRSQEQLVLEDFSEDQIEIAEVDSEKQDLYYIFNFVGTISINGIIIHCYPKYIKSNDKPVKEYKQVLKVLEKFFNRKQDLQLFLSNLEFKSYNLLSLYLFLIEDYFENDVYTKEVVIDDINGSGEIDWNRTINRDGVIFDNNTPYYYDLVTRKRLPDESNYFRKLHECILTLISKDMKDAGLLDLLDITEIDLSDKMISDFGDDDYILYELEKELNEEFNTRKRLVLNSMSNYISQNKHLTDYNGLTFFGTNSFYHVWEEVCAAVLDNQLNLPLRELNLPKPLAPFYNPNDTLLNLIEKPLWTVTGNYAADTFIPDIISIGLEEDKYVFSIYDAKYYTAILNPNTPPLRQPGIESISKQFFYQLAYSAFINDHGFNCIKNCFILPTERDEIIDKKQVQMEIMENINLESIEVRFLPAAKMYEYYLEDKKIKPSKLFL